MKKMSCTKSLHCLHSSSNWIPETRFFCLWGKQPYTALTNDNQRKANDFILKVFTAHVLHANHPSLRNDPLCHPGLSGSCSFKQIHFVSDFMLTLTFERTCPYTFTNWLNYWPSILLKHPSLSWCLQRHCQYPNKLGCCYAWNYRHADKKCPMVTDLPNLSSPFATVLECKSFITKLLNLQRSVWLNTGWKQRFPSAIRFQRAVTRSLSGVYKLIMVLFFILSHVICNVLISKALFTHHW